MAQRGAISTKKLFSLVAVLLVAVLGVASANQLFNFVLFLLLRQGEATVGLGIEFGTFLFVTAGFLALAIVATGKSWRICLIFFLPGLFLLLGRTLVVLFFWNEGVVRLGMAVLFMAAAAAIAGVIILFREEQRRFAAFTEPEYR
jgi:hypothetical protein